jgi:hypothetical protein
MHVTAHKLPCPWLFNPKFFYGVGLTDGETCERAWSILGRYATTTKNMSPQNRRDLLERGILCYFIKNLYSQRKNLEKKKRVCTEFLKLNRY